MTRAAGRLGRSGLSRPAINIRDFVDIEKAQAWPVKELPTVDYASIVWQWRMYLNDQLGDCTVAGLAHGRQVFYQMVHEPHGPVTDAQIAAMYEGSGYVPGNSSTDQGWTLEGAAQWAMQHGLTGTPGAPAPDILGYAGVSLTDQDAQQVGMQLFGGLYEGAALPQSAQAQYESHMPWILTTNSPGDAGSWGGHCMWRPKAILHGYHYHVTWGGLQVSTAAWDEAYVDELMVLVPALWESRMPTALVAAGIVDFAKLRSLVGRFTK